MNRQFISTPAVRARVPLIIALSGAAGSGKTMSALRLASGMQSVFGGDINVVDTEKGRALHYADEFRFIHTPFDPPYGPGDYSDALRHVRETKPGVMIIDQLSYEHDGLGGVLEIQEEELQRMAGNDWAKREKCKWAAWIKPKADRRRLVNEIVQIGAQFAIIMCFRAKDTVKPVRSQNGKLEVEECGFLPIAAPEFLFEATASCVLYPGSNGVPTWQTEFKGERLFIKLPTQFRDILAPGKQLNEEMGKRLAEWARGTTPAEANAAVPVPAPTFNFPPEWSLEEQGENVSRNGMAELQRWWGTLTAEQKKRLKPRLDGEWKGNAQAKDAA